MSKQKVDQDVYLAMGRSQENSLPPCGGGSGWGVFKKQAGKWVLWIWVLVLWMIGLQMTMLLLGISIGINPTESQPYRLFLILKGRPVERGDLVAFRFPGSNYYPEGTLFVKEIKGIPNDHLDVRRNRTVWLNETFLDTVRATDSQGRALEPFYFDGAIPNSAYFLYSRATNSYDSRYYGLISKERIVGKVIPLF